jgi:hypothetical protein
MTGNHTRISPVIMFFSRRDFKIYPALRFDFAMSRVDKILLLLQGRSPSRHHPVARSN